MQHSVPRVYVMSPDRPRLLLLSYYFYPFNGCGGAIRAIKLAKYLHRSGFEVHVLCGGWESESGDLSYARDMEGLHLHVANPAPQAPTIEDNTPRPELLRLGGRLLRSVIPFPDNRFRYLPRLAAEARRLIAEHDLQLVLVTLPPNSTGLLVPMLRRTHPQLPMVLEFRDMWALDPISTPRHAWFRFWQKQLERWTLNRCDLVVSCTPGMTRWVEGQLKEPQRALTVLSGYDEDDFDFEPLPRREGRCLISYAGTTGGVSGPRTLQYIDGALSRVLAARPELRGVLQVEIIGHCDDATRRQIAGFDNTSCFELRGFMSHDQVLVELSRADILLLNLFDAPGIEIVYPGKTWEYMRLGKPMWVAAPKGLLQRLVTETHRLGEWAEFTDPTGLAAALLRLLEHRDDFPAAYEIGADRYRQYACDAVFRPYAERLRGLVDAGAR
jgi:glycosyltransferase involved in cell wall biosynthesis